VVVLATGDPWGGRIMDMVVKKVRKGKKVQVADKWTPI
jgi:hypothetical protein